MRKTHLTNYSAWFDLGIGVILTGFAFILTILILSSDSPNKLVGYIFLPIWYTFSYLCLATAVYRLAYRKVSRDLSVTVDRMNKSLTLINHSDGTTRTIGRGDIKEVEIYHSWNTSPFSSDLGYSKLTLVDGSKVFLTCSMVSQSTINNLFKTKVRKVRTRFMNKLK